MLNYSLGASACFGWPNGACTLLLLFHIHLIVLLVTLLCSAAACHSR
jgi:hypothetical protein